MGPVDAPMRKHHPCSPHPDHHQTRGGRHEFGPAVKLLPPSNTCQLQPNGVYSKIHYHDNSSKSLLIHLAIIHRAPTIFQENDQLIEKTEFGI